MEPERRVAVERPQSDALGEGRSLRVPVQARRDIVTPARMSRARQGTLKSRRQRVHKHMSARRAPPALGPMRKAKTKYVSVGLNLPRVAKQYAGNTITQASLLCSHCRLGPLPALPLATRALASGDCARTRTSH